MKLFSTALAIVLSVAPISSAVISQCVQNGMFAMSFDDGPTQNTLRLLDILKQYNVKATFHFVTRYGIPHWIFP